MPSHPMKLVTVICEALAREPLTRLFRDMGANGYTVSQVEGAGAKGERTGELTELANIKVEAIVPPALCERLMERLNADFFPRFAIIAFESDVRVLRPEKF
jgi:nitrogen regulatory protein P-II 2